MANRRPLVWASGGIRELPNGDTLPDDALALTPADIGAQPASADLSALAALSPNNDDVIQRKSGSWVSRTLAQLKTDLALAASDVVSGVFAIARIPTGTSSTTVATGDHTHSPAAVYAAPRSLGTVSTNQSVDGTAAGDALYTVTGNVEFTPTGTPSGRLMLIKGLASGAQRTMSVPTTVKLPTTGGPTSRSLTVPTGDMGVFAVGYDSLAAAWMLHSAQVVDL